MIDLDEINRLHAETVSRWHGEAIGNPYEGFLRAVCEQHACNFRLWHEEDAARDPDADDATIARVKRAIDALNQQRNDRIETLDELLLEQLREAGAAAPDDAPLNTETPGSAIDRLSILALRIFHLEEILHDEPPDTPRRQQTQARLAVCRRQQRDLTDALRQLLDDIHAGRKQLKLYRQLKMYNDPMFNPYLSETSDTDE